ncbi:pyridoxamine 5'-phosphate oxidase family protein [Furfurilactobacillus siliginis]|nr:pyridoxamine 5'-phosphate oxidase family protein [Furfurilactobacillus siliginis]GEK28968.1 pyridoxamine 5'-phosphate oxidase [Furfurilactobacillus siliginis]
MTDNIALLQQVYSSADKLALATSLNGTADVKILNFVWFKDEPDTLYFSSVKGTNAAAIYANNPDAALITVPQDDTPNNPYVRAHHITITPSTKTMAELLPRYLELVPNYQHTWDAIGDSLVVYKITLHDVHVDAGLGQEKIDLTF